MNDMTKIKNFTFIGTYENLASDDYCDRMVAKYESLIKESSTNMSYGDLESGAGKRKDTNFYFSDMRNDAEDLCIETNQILDKALAKYVDEYPSLAPISYYSRVIKVQKTPPKGGFHEWHREHGMGEASHRILVWTIYLNDIPKGEGETEFLEYGLKVQPKKGSVCFFPAGFTHTHRGNAVYTKDKYIATGWYYIV